MLAQSNSTSAHNAIPIHLTAAEGDVRCSTREIVGVYIDAFERAVRTNTQVEEHLVISQIRCGLSGPLSGIHIIFGIKVG